MPNHQKLLCTIIDILFMHEVLHAAPKVILYTRLLGVGGFGLRIHVEGMVAFGKIFEHGVEHVLQKVTTYRLIVKHKNTFIYSRYNDVNSSLPSAAYMRQWTESALVQVMACRLFCAKPLPEPVLAYC